MYVFKSNFEMGDIVSLLKHGSRYNSTLLLFTRVLLWICLVLILLMAMAWVEMRFSSQPVMYLKILTVVAVCALWWAVWRLLCSVNLRGMLDAIQSMGPTVIRVDGQGVTSDADGIVTSIAWGRIIRLVETPTHILPYYAPRLAMILRKADLCAGEAERLSAYVREHVPSPGSASI